MRSMILLLAFIFPSLAFSDVTGTYWGGKLVPAFVTSSTHIQIIKPSMDNPGAAVKVVSPDGEYTHTFY